jgi:hypothetical protein
MYGLNLSLAIKKAPLQFFQLTSYKEQPLALLSDAH